MQFLGEVYTTGQFTFVICVLYASVYVAFLLYVNDRNLSIVKKGKRASVIAKHQGVEMDSEKFEAQHKSLKKKSLRNMLVLIPIHVAIYLVIFPLKGLSWVHYVGPVIEYSLFAWALHINFRLKGQQVLFMNRFHDAPY